MGRPSGRRLVFRPDFATKSLGDMSKCANNNFRKHTVAPQDYALETCELDKNNAVIKCMCGRGGVMIYVFIVSHEHHQSVMKPHSSKDVRGSAPCSNVAFFRL